MIGSSSMHHRPYVRAHERTKTGRPYIARITPRSNGFDCDVIDDGAPHAKHTLWWRPAKGGTEAAQPLAELFGSVRGLEENADYTVWVAREDGTSSVERMVKTGIEIPDAVVVDYLHPDDLSLDCSGRALGAPALVRLPSGALLAADCVFCDRTVWPSLPNLSRLFRSEDEGDHWTYVCDLLPSFNGSLFVHRGILYFLALDGDYCNLIITASWDEGATWSDPVTLFRGESPHRWGWHSSAMAPLEHRGRLYKAIEFGHVAEYGANGDAAPEGAWCHKGLYFDLAHHLGVLSIDADADPLVAENWRMSDLYYPREVDPHQCIEGNMVERQGVLFNILRTMNKGISLRLTVEDDPEAPLRDPVTLTDFPLSAVSKFEIKRDPKTGNYIALGNDGQYNRKRLVMAVSKDLRSWRIAYEIADARGTEDAYSYPDFIFSGEDLLLLSRTAYNGAKNNHDTNMITFHRIKSFRQYC